MLSKVVSKEKRSVDNVLSYMHQNSNVTYVSESNEYVCSSDLENC